MVTNHNGRKITITRTKQHGFRAWQVRIEGQDHWTYPAHQYATEEIVLDMLRKLFDFIDADQKIGFDWYMYAKSDPRRQKVLDHQLGAQAMTEEERGIVRAAR